MSVRACASVPRLDASGSRVLVIGFGLVNRVSLIVCEGISRFCTVSYGKCDSRCFKAGACKEVRSPHEEAHNSKSFALE